MSFPGGPDGNKSFCNECRRPQLDPWIGKIPWRRAWQPIPVFLPGKSPQPEEFIRLHSMGSHRVRQDCATKHSTTQA